jgi:hypothetical protein
VTFVAVPVGPVVTVIMAVPVSVIVSVPMSVIISMPMSVIMSVSVSVPVVVSPAARPVATIAETAVSASVSLAMSPPPTSAFVTVSGPGRASVPTLAPAREPGRTSACRCGCVPAYIKPARFSFLPKSPRVSGRI